MLQLAVFRWAKNRFVRATSSGKPAASVPAVASSQSLHIPQCRVSPAGVWIAQEHFPKRKAYPPIVSEICCRPLARAGVRLGDLVWWQYTKTFFQVLVRRVSIHPFPPKRERNIVEINLRLLPPDSCRWVLLRVRCCNRGGASLNRRLSAAFCLLNFGPKTPFKYFKSNRMYCLICLWL